ncbi:hypothetical protein B0A49_09376 [Cryomyces minteri]|uniref:Methyltransferase type 11 domain-containing protein n=1 Tax=Cryomyces minteri TaxID=331657 RepID=A0A4U0WSL6_9PEZI|nr:hypothetical protein B0A49_09376 [Cryomyces minteri]
MDLSTLSEAPQHYPDCCLGLSRKLIETLLMRLPRRPALVLSIGSGSGLLEATIQKANSSDTTIDGVEVSRGINGHLPEEQMHYVGGTWDLGPEAATASAWMFVYPREPKLLVRYLDHFGEGAVKMVIWLGPRADWPAFETVLRNAKFGTMDVVEDCGLTPYETLAVIKKSDS